MVSGPEERDVLGGDPALQEDAPLHWSGEFGWHRRHSVDLDLVSQSVSTGLDGHAGAVEALGKQDALSAEALVGRRKFYLGQAERVPQVEDTVHVRIGESTEVLFACFTFGRYIVRSLRKGGVHFEHLTLLPSLLRRFLDGAQTIPPDRRHVRVPVLSNISRSFFKRVSV